MKKNRLLAILTASILGAAAVCGSAQAATFQEVEKASMEEIKKYILEAPTEAPLPGQTAGLHVQLEDAGRAIAGMMVPLDISWLDHADINVKSSTADNIQSAVITVSLNDTNLLTINEQMDLTTMDIVLQAPEVSNGVLKTNYTELMKLSASAQVGSEGESEEVPLTPEQYADLYLASMNLKQNPISPETAALLFDRYVSIIVDAYEEGEAGTDTVSVEGYTENAETVEGILTTENALEMSKVILNTAKEDADLKGVIEQAAAGTSSEATVYESFRNAIDQIIAELDKEDADVAETEGEFSALSVKLWVNEAGKCIGVQLGESKEGGVEPVFLAQYPSGEDGSALNAEIKDEDAPLRISGSGQKSEGKLFGLYNFYYGDTAMASIQADQTAERKAGEPFDGEYLITPITDEENASNPMNSLSGFALGADVHTEKGAGSLKLDVQSSGSSMVSVTLDGQEVDETVTVEIPADAQTYDLADESALGEYMGTVDPTSVFTALMSAGMPEDFMSQVSAMMSSGSSDDYSVEEEPAA